jgi:hypothetical protein
VRSGNNRRAFHELRVKRQKWGSESFKCYCNLLDRPTTYTIYNLLFPGKFSFVTFFPNGSDAVGARTSELESRSLPFPAGGAESLDGSFLSSFSGLRDVGSPS